MWFYGLSVALAGGLYWAVTTAALAGRITLPSMTQAVLLFVWAVTAGVYTALRNQSKDPENFVRLYLLATVGRILLFGVFIWFILFLDPNGGTGNAVLFLVSYLFFTALEVSFLFFGINGNKRPGEPQKET